MRVLIVVTSLMVASPVIAQTQSSPTGSGSEPTGGAAGSGASALDTPASNAGSTPRTTPSARPPRLSSSATSTPPVRSTSPPRSATSTPRRTPRPTPPPPDDDEEDDGGEIFWIDATAGFSYVDIIQFSQENFIPDVLRTNGTGMTAGLGAGLRLLFVTVGARATVASYPGAHVGTAVLDLALKLPLPIVEPFVRVGFGYAWLGDADVSVPGSSHMSVDGLALEAGLGVDIYLSDIFSIGAGFDAAFLNLSRQKASCATSDCSIDTVNFEENGDAAGLQLRFAARAGLHF